MKRLFISDLHLENLTGAAGLGLSRLLSREAAWAQEIYLLGDIVEMWIGDDDNSPLATGLADSLTNAAQHADLFFMHGNRDFLVGEAFARQAGLTLLTDPFRTPDGLLLSHGDALCTDDHEYQQMRVMLRSAEWQQGILSQSLDARRALGAQLRNESRTRSANKPQNIMDVNADAVDALMKEHHCTTLIHGHTHRPGDHHLDGEYRRIVTGAWERCGWLCRQSGSDLALECFALPAE